jgi:hypothetical protein
MCEVEGQNACSTLELPLGQPTLESTMQHRARLLIDTIEQSADKRRHPQHHRALPWRITIPS